VEYGNFQYLFGVMPQKGTKRISHKKAQQTAKIKDEKCLCAYVPFYG
jgi:hypothetical protein